MYRICILLCVLFIALTTLISCVPNLTAQNHVKQLTNRENSGEAMAVLIKMGPDAVPALIKGMKSKNAFVTNGCSKVLWILGPDAESAIPYFAEALRDEDWSLKSIGASGLAAIGKPAIPALLEAMEDKDPWARRFACVSVGRMNPPPTELVPKLLEMMNDPHSRTAMAAVEVLGKMGPAAKDAVDPLLERFKALKPGLKTGNTDEWQIAVALGRIGPDAIEALPYLREALEREEDVTYKNYLSIAIALLEGPEFLVEILEAEESGISWNAAKEFAYLGTRTDEAVRLLLSDFDKDDGRHRNVICMALTNIGPPASDAIPALIELVSGNKATIGWGEPVKALAVIGRDDASIVPVLIDALEYGNLHEKIAAATGLGQMGSIAADAIPHLQKAADDDTPQRIGWCGNEIPDYHVRPEALIAIALIERAIEKEG